MAISAPRDANRIPVLIGTSSSDGSTPVTVYVDPTTHRLLVDSASSAGTVTSVSVVSANGFAGTVATSTTTPAITLSTTITGLLKGNGTAISAATAGTDYTDASFKTILVAGQSDVVADSASDTLTLVAGSNVTITTDAGTDTITIASSGGASGITIGTTTITSGTTTRILYNNAGVVGEYTLTGTGTVVAMQTSPSLLTSLLMDTGFVMNWATSNVVLTHTSGILTLGTGTLKITNPTNNTTSVVTCDGTQSLTNKTYNGNTWTAGTGVLTIAAGKTLTVNNSITIAGTDSTVMTFPTTSKTIAANDGSNWTFGSQAIGDIIYASSTTAFTRLAAVAVGQVLVSAGTGTAPAYSANPSVTTLELGSGGATDTTLSRVSAGVVAIEGVNILTVAGGTLTGNIVLGENTSIDLDPAGSADGKYSGICITGTAGATLAFGDLIYLAVADSRWELTDADASATGGPVLIGMCVLAAAGDGSATKILLQGQIRADAKFPALTIGAPVYLGETAGAIQVAIPTGADNVIRVVGFALTADEIYFNPSQDHQISVA